MHWLVLSLSVNLLPMYHCGFPPHSFFLIPNLNIHAHGPRSLSNSSDFIGLPITVLRYIFISRDLGHQ